jgi:hypothetical protein
VTRSNLYHMIPPKGTILRAQAELAVSFRRARRAFLADPQVQHGIALLQRVPWWVPYAFSFAFIGWSVWYGDIGWMLAAALYALWIVWIRR